MKLIIVRHGKSTGNATNVVLGHTPGDLSEEGREQVKKVALRLKDEKIDHIYSSDLKRALETAKGIAKYHKGVPFTITEELRERDWGIYDNRTKEDINWDKVSNSIELFGYPENGENLEEMYERSERLIHELLGKHLNETVLLVTHNEIKKAMICVITGKKPKDIFDVGRSENTAVSIFEIDENRNHKIHILSCDKHLR